MASIKRYLKRNAIKADEAACIFAGLNPTYFLVLGGKSEIKSDFFLKEIAPNKDDSGDMSRPNFSRKTFREVERIFKPHPKRSLEKWIVLYWQYTRKPPYWLGRVYSADDINRMRPKSDTPHAKIAKARDGKSESGIVRKNIVNAYKKDMRSIRNFKAKKNFIKSMKALYYRDKNGEKSKEGEECVEGERTISSIVNLLYKITNNLNLPKNFPQWAVEFRRDYLKI